MDKEKETQCRAMIQALRAIRQEREIESMKGERVKDSLSTDRVFDQRTE